MFERRGGGDLDPHPRHTEGSWFFVEVEMRRYDDPVEVRRGMVPCPSGPMEGPEQFLWKGRLWKVRDVVAHWVETGPWWQGDPDQDLLAEREVWRVEAGRGLAAVDGGGGVFDLVFDGGRGSWQLARAVD